MSELSDLIERYYAARTAHDEAKVEASRMHSRMRGLEEDLITAMAEAGHKSLKQDDGTTIILRKHFSLSCTRDNIDLTREWLLKVRGDDRDFIEEVVNKAALVEWVKSEVALGKTVDEFPEFLNVKDRPIVAVTGWTQR